MTVTSAVLVQVPLLMVQRSTYVPTILTVAVEEPDEALLNVTVPGPETLVHVPAPISGVLPPNEPLSSVPQ